MNTTTPTTTTASGQFMRRVRLLIWITFAVVLIAYAAHSLSRKPAAPADPNAPADFTIGAEVIAASPERFGANISLGDAAGGQASAASVFSNNFSRDPGMEPVVLRYLFSADSGGEDFILCERDGGLAMWDTIADGFFDGASVRIYRAADGKVKPLRTGTIQSYQASGNRIVLKDKGEPVRKGDILFIDFNPDNAPAAKTHRGKEHLKKWDTWEPFGPATYDRDAGTTAPEQGGRCSMKIATGQREEVGVRQYAFRSPEDDGAALTPRRAYRVDAWLKMKGGDGEARFWMNQDYQMVKTVFKGVTNDWRKFSYTFEGPPYPKKGGAAIQNHIGFTGPGTLWVDNLVIVDAALPPFAFRPEAVQAFKDFHPGALRLWSGQTNGEWGTTLEDWTNPDVQAMVQWHSNNGRTAGSRFKLPSALSFCKQTGAAPWLIAGLYFSEKEWLGLMEYLAGPADTEYGRKRKAQGQERPWTQEFDRIRIELGNETWNGMFVPWNFKGNGALYGQFAEYFFAAAKSSPYYAAAAGKIDFIVNGWLIQADKDGYGQKARLACPSAALVDVTGYSGGWDMGVDTKKQKLTVNDEGFQKTLLNTPMVMQYFTDKHCSARESLGKKAAYRLAVYEGGPGYDLPDPDSPFTEVGETYGKSLAAGVTTLDTFLYNSSKGFGPQCFFLFQPGPNWASHSSVASGYHPHACWLALSMRNRHASGDMVAVATNSTPTVDLDAHELWGNRIPARPRAPLAASYAFKDGNKYSVFVLSRKLKDETPVTLHFPFNPDVSAKLYKLTGDPRANNIRDEKLKIQEEEVKNFSKDYAFTLPPGSVYLFTCKDPAGK